MDCTYRETCPYLHLCNHLDFCFRVDFYLLDSHQIACSRIESLGDLAKSTEFSSFEFKVLPSGNIFVAGHFCNGLDSILISSVMRNLSLAWKYSSLWSSLTMCFKSYSHALAQIRIKLSNRRNFSPSLSSIYLSPSLYLVGTFELSPLSIRSPDRLLKAKTKWIAASDLPKGWLGADKRKSTPRFGAFVLPRPTL